MVTELSAVNRALLRVPRRAEAGQAERLADTFVDCGMAAGLESRDHQVVFGRRGTGKTHALRFLQSRVAGWGDLAVYVDLRTVGSPVGLFPGESLPVVERAARLLVDLLGQVHEAVLTAVLAEGGPAADAGFVSRLDQLLAAITAVRITGEVETEAEQESTSGTRDSVEAQVTLGPAPQLGVRAGGQTSADRRERVRAAHKGVARRAVNFTDLARALRDVGTALGGVRVWLLLDEWSAVPGDLQPLLAEFLTRCVLPLPGFTVKIATIEAQSTFRAASVGGVVGFELGADIAADVDLDEVMVYERDPARSRDFFAGMFHRHLTVGAEAAGAGLGLGSPADLVRVGFADPRAFDELVMAAEGVPRDGINIAAKAAARAGGGRITLTDVRVAARSWYLADKQAALAHHAQASALLDWLVDQVIRGRRARAFLVAQADARSPLLVALYEARVLHLYRRGYSAQDAPGQRYDVWVIDYGAYVDLLATRHAPHALLPVGEEQMALDEAEGRGEGDADQGSLPPFRRAGLDAAAVDVPALDLRAIRRAVLDLDAFTRATPDPEPDPDPDPEPDPDPT